MIDPTIKPEWQNRSKPGLLRRLSDAGRASIVKAMLMLWGRRNLVRIGRFISDAGRLDGPNDLDVDGELLVQDAVVRRANRRDTLTAFDVGANIGRWTHALLLRGHAAGVNIKVHAFEPCDTTRQTLAYNIKSWGCEDLVDVQEEALSTEEGTRAFFSLGTNMGRNGLYPHRGEQDSTQTVRTTSLAAYCNDHSVKRIHLLKIDVEGHEFEVLLGAAELFRSNVVDVAQFEYSGDWLQGRRLLKDVFEFLSPLNYRIGKVSPRGIEFYPHWDLELETFRDGNYVAVRSDLDISFPHILWWKS